VTVAQTFLLCLLDTALHGRSQNIFSKGFKISGGISIENRRKSRFFCILHVKAYNNFFGNLFGGGLNS